MVNQKNKQTFSRPRVGEILWRTRPGEVHKHFIPLIHAMCILTSPVQSVQLILKFTIVSEFLLGMWEKSRPEVAPTEENKSQESECLLGCFFGFPPSYKKMILLTEQSHSAFIFTISLLYFHIRFYKKGHIAFWRPTAHLCP